MTEPIPQGESEGQCISHDNLQLMLDDYYHARGWDPKTGIPTRAKLVELGLTYVADQLGL